MNLARLRAFHAVATSGSFTAAAAALAVTQPTLSAQVKALEEDYGAALFVRRGRGVGLTELGHALAEVTRRLFVLEAEAETLLSGARDLLTGTLHVAADGPYHALPILARFRQRHPGIAIALAIGNSDAALEAVLRMRAEAAVLADVAPDPSLHIVPCGRFRLLAFMPRRHVLARRRRLTLADLDGAPMVLREPGSRTRDLFARAAAAAGIRVAPVMEIESREAVREAVAAGLGLGIVAEPELGHDTRLVAVPIEPAIETREFVVCLKERLPQRLVAAFLACV